jgi:hypothetical protein
MVWHPLRVREADVSQRRRLADREATWIHDIQAFEIAPPLVIRF